MFQTFPLPQFTYHVNGENCKINHLKIDQKLSSNKEILNFEIDHTISRIDFFSEIHQDRYVPHIFLIFCYVYSWSAVNIGNIHHIKLHDSQPALHSQTPVIILLFYWRNIGRQLSKNCMQDQDFFFFRVPYLNGL